MNFLKIFFLAAVLIVGTPLSLGAQNPPPRTPVPPEAEAERIRIQAEERRRIEMEERDWETRIFPVRYVDPWQLSVALTLFRARMQPTQDPRVLAVRAPKEIMPAIEDAIKRLDVPTPSKNAELTIYILIASEQPDAGNSIPSSLQSVVNQLRNVLSYKGYQLVDTLIARATDRRNAPTSLMGTLPTGGSYDFGARFRIDNPDGKAPALRLDDMHFRLRFDRGNVGPAVQVSITTDVEIPRSQQVVVGKATYGDKAYILVMSAQFPN